MTARKGLRVTSYTRGTTEMIMLVYPGDEMPRRGATIATTGDVSGMHYVIRVTSVVAVEWAKVVEGAVCVTLRGHKYAQIGG